MNIAVFKVSQQSFGLQLKSVIFQLKNFPSKLAYSHTRINQVIDWNRYKNSQIPLGTNKNRHRWLTDPKESHDIILRYSTSSCLKVWNSGQQKHSEL